ncbi:microsomal signal peptidase 12 kDa subunit [Exidia glandulosa HHB12029]|uniref:Signal peptidase complex subunit 1 n=1 Tax=Exidia glandulosa HHB12029 TaxID=1314781 RepID=A0A165QX14_EXIGL|nr:microsomal signal peptidase 12 kDa subunit [Exidia glandulosa HHB12029]
MDDILKLVEFKIDFEGQKLAELIYRVVAVAATLLAFIVGYATQSMLACVAIFGGASVLLLAGLTIPWPAFNAHPVVWLPEVQSKESAKKTQ